MRNDMATLLFVRVKYQLDADELER